MIKESQDTHASIVLERRSSQGRHGKWFYGTNLQQIQWVRTKRAIKVSHGNRDAKVELWSWFDMHYL